MDLDFPALIIRGKSTLFGENVGEFPTKDDALVGEFTKFGD